jgi:hypothetical protein
MFRWPSATVEFKPRLADGCAICLLLVSGVLTRFIGLSDWSIWGDEIYSWNAARMPLSDMWRWTANDLHPPLYYAVLHAWIAAFGDSEIALRSLSAIASISSALLLYLALRGAVGRGIAAMAAGFLLLNPAFLFYSTEARMYPLAGLLALLSAIGFAWFVAKQSLARWVVWASSTVALLYTDYSGFFVVGMLIACGLWYVFRIPLGGQRWRLLVGLFAILAVVVFAYLPWWVHFIDHAQRGATEQHVPAPTWSSTMQVYQNAWGLERAGTLWIPLVLTFVIGGMTGVLRRISSPVVLAIALLGCVSMAQIMFSLVSNPVFDLKRVSPYISGLTLLAAIGIAELDRIGSRLLRMESNLAVAALPVALTTTVMILGVVQHQRSAGVEDWRRPAADMDSNLPSYAWPSHVVEHLRYYAPKSADLRYLQRTAVSAAAAGYSVFPRETTAPVRFFYAPEGYTDEVDQILESSRLYFNVSTPKTYGHGEYSVVLTPFARTAYNVHVDLDEWSRTTAGYMAPNSTATVDIQATFDTAGMLEIEYEHESGEPPVVTSSRGVGLTMLTDEFTIEARITRFWVPPGTHGPFRLEGLGETFRLEYSKLSLGEGLEVVRDETALGRQVFLRRDGYLQSVSGMACVTAEESVEALTLDLEYLLGDDWKNLSIVSESSSNGFRCISVPAARPIRSISITRAS